jgi:cyclic beta-1,2-glucan synthetase
VPFLDGPALGVAEHHAFFQPLISAESATLFEHCARGIDRCLALLGEMGLPLIGGGDWNDGMNRVGAAGRGESVWLGWLLVRTLALLAPYADARDAARAAHWRARATSLAEALERHAWDGAWYRRATFDDGSWLGSKTGAACRIDSIAQSWAVLSGAGDPARAATAMASMETHLIRREERLALLFSPPFDGASPDPGYIEAYPPGIRENGGQYSHAAIWSVLALTRLGEGAKAAALFSMLNPINHTDTPAGAARYKVEPYVVAADVYSAVPHSGRGGWTWYTGAAGWMYRAGVEGILGIRREAAWLIVEPCIPAAWPEFEATVRLGACHYDIRVEALPPGAGGAHAVLDGLAIRCHAGGVRVPLDDGTHTLLLRIVCALE